MKTDVFRNKQARLARAMAQGTGGLKFVAQSPPGLGRLIRIPFYLQDNTTRYAALIGSTGVAVAAALVGAAITSTTHPVVCVGPPAATGAGVTAVLRTPQISWALLRIVGFEVTMYTPPNDDSYPMELAVSDLQIGGGANLFVHEDFAPAAIYLAGQDSFAGLRDYPVLESPNTCEVQVQNLGHITSNRIDFGCNLVCEILMDDQAGAHVPGPYARPGAMVRQGGSFMVR
jgi:hypothetical protein